jgi:precorrin-3B synthase
MTATAIPRRRGTCPGLSEPLPTGDGLLVRLMPIGTVSLAAFGQLCAAAQAHGNGIVEISSRGSIQVRGLNAASAPRFAADIAALNIAADDGVPVLCNTLSGIDAEEIFDAANLAADLRRALAQRSMAAKLDAKVSIVIDGGGALGLARIPADFRLTAEIINGDVMLRVGAGGDDRKEADVGIVAPGHGVETVMRSLEVLAIRGRDARARDVLLIGGADVFRAALAELLVARPPKPASRSGEPIGPHPLRDGLLACGVGLAFGHADATSFRRLADAAEAAGASGLRAAPGRALMIIGLSANTASAFMAAAARLGFIVGADDPRRFVVACAGAPICISAHIAARALAPRIAEIATPWLGGAHMIHVSGCPKGCAHAAEAALTVVGTSQGCALVANGSARDAPFAVVATEALSSAIAAHMHEAAPEKHHG